MRWREGNVVTLNVTNNMPELTGLHWLLWDKPVTTELHSAQAERMR